METDLISIAEAAEIAGVSSTTVRVWIKAGKLRQYSVLRGITKVAKVDRHQLRAILRIAELKGEMHMPLQCPKCGKRSQIFKDSGYCPTPNCENGYPDHNKPTNE
jgi:excisionase family DNA binding protein